MNIYKLDDPIDPTFAQAVRLGTWFPIKSKPCPECGRSNQKRVPPLIIEWEQVPVIVGDFTWPGFNEDVVVVQHVRDLLENNFKGLQFEKVEVRQKIRRLKKISGIKPQVWLPHNGKPLWDMFITSWCHVDLALTGLKLEKECLICGEKTLSSINPANDKITIDSSTWDGADFFRISEYPRWVYCTEQAKIFIQDAELTNITFSLSGNIQKDEPN